MRLQYILPAAAALIALVGPASAASVSSTFDTDAEGWGVGNIRSNLSTAPDPSNPPTYNATGGNPGGYISTTDTEDIVAFLAPGKFLGDDSAFLGGKLTFDLQDLVPPDDAAYPAVVLYTSTGSISYTSISPGATWTSFSIPLTATGWTVYPGGESNGTIPVTDAEFAAALAGVVNLAIEADWHTGDDITGLDNVVLASGGSGSRALDMGHDDHGVDWGGFPIASREARRSSPRRPGVSARYSLRLTDETAEGLAVSSSHFSSRV